MKKKENEVTLDGRWRLSRRFTVEGGDRRNLTTYGREDHIVEFPAQGIITERSGNEVTTVIYHYDPPTRVIDIRQSDRAAPSPLSCHKNNLFRVIPLNEREMYFQKPYSVEAEDPHTEFEMILLERI